MPEPVAWQYQKLIKPIFDSPAEDHILRGSAPTCSGNEVIADGLVESVQESVTMTFKERRRFV